MGEDSARKLIDKWQADYDRMFARAEANLTLAEDAKKDAEKDGTWTPELDDLYYRAVFNLAFVEADGSRSVHNPQYVKEILAGVNDDANEIIIQTTGEDPAQLPITEVPADGSVDVPLDVLIIVIFGKDIDFDDPDGLITVSGGVTGDLTYDPSTYTLTFTPATALAPSTTHTVTLDGRVQYTDGFPVLDEDYVWSFKTVIVNGSVDDDVQPDDDVTDDDDDEEEKDDIIFYLNVVVIGVIILLALILLVLIFTIGGVEEEEEDFVVEEEEDEFEEDEEEELEELPDIEEEPVDLAELPQEGDEAPPDENELPEGEQT
jgi:hypothetical protein